MKTILLLASCLITLNISISSAQSGALDFSFSDDGRLTTTFQKPIGVSATASTVQADGKIVVIGENGNSAARTVNIARFNTSGSIDVSFGIDGKVVIDLGGFIAHSIAIQQDGKIVAAGVTSGFGSVMVVRFNSNGTLDNNFGQEGIVITEIGANSRAESIAIQTDGKILAVGETYNGTDGDFLLIRYNTDGTLDSSFNGTGIITRFGSSDDEGDAVALLPDGKIIAAGTIGGNDLDFFVARYTSKGKLDKTFDGDGVATVDFYDITK